MIWQLLMMLPGVVNGLFSYLSKRSDNAVLTNGQNVTGDTTVAQARLTAYVEERKVIAQERAAFQGSAWTRWMIPVAFGLCVLHFGAIVLDSTFRLSWGVEKLPQPYDALEWSIFMAVIGKAGVESTVRRIFR